MVYYNCGDRGHTSRQCPSEALYCGPKSPLKSSQSKPLVTKCEGVVDSKFVSDIVLDTGCTRTLVHRDLVSEEKLMKGESVTIQCAHGDAVAYPLANVELEVEGEAVTVEAAVSETLPQSVLLGTYVPKLLSLLRVREGGKALMVVTRSQAQRLQRAAHSEQGKSSDSSSRLRPAQEPEVAMTHEQ